MKYKLLFFSMVLCMTITSSRAAVIDSSLYYIQRQVDSVVASNVQHMVDSIVNRELNRQINSEYIDERIDELTNDTLSAYLVKINNVQKEHNKALLHKARVRVSVFMIIAVIIGIAVPLRINYIREKRLQKTKKKVKEIQNYTEQVQVYEMACCVWKEKDFEKRLDIAFKMNEMHPNDEYTAFAHYVLGTVYKDAGKYDEAIKVLSEVVRRNPYKDERQNENERRNVEYNDCCNEEKPFMREKDYKDAIEKLEDAYLNLGTTYYDNKEYAKAINNYSEAVKLMPKTNLVYKKLGQVYSDTENYDQAIQNLSKAIEMYSKDSLAYIYLSDVYNKMGKYDQAIMYYTIAIKLAPDNAEAYNKRGLAYISQSDYNKAIADFTEAIRLKLYYAEAYNNLAVVLCQQKDFEKALPYVNKAIELEPNKSNFYDTRCDVYMGLQQWGDALNDANKGLEIAQSKGETDIIALLEPKKKRIEDEIKKQKNNNAQQN